MHFKEAITGLKTLSKVISALNEHVTKIKLLISLETCYFLHKQC